MGTTSTKLGRLMAMAGFSPVCTCAVKIGLQWRKTCFASSHFQQKSNFAFYESKKWPKTPWTYKNKYGCTIDQELKGAAVYTRGRRFVFTHQMAAQHILAWNDNMAAILKLWRQIKNYGSVSQWVFSYVKNISVKFSPDPIWKDGALDFLKRSRQQEEGQQQQDEFPIYKSRT